MLKPTLLLLALTLCGAASAQEVATPKRPMLDEYRGVTIEVRDDYRWLENFDDPETQKWNAAQNARTRAYLDAIPDRAEIRKRVADYYQKVSPSYFDLEVRRGTYFALKFAPPKDQPLLVAMKSPDKPATEKVLFDPNVQNSSGTLSVDWYVPSLLGKWVAVAMSEKGSEDSSLYFLDAKTGKQLTDRVPRVNYPTAGGSAAWNADGTGVYYTRLPQGNERPKEDANFYQQIWFHKLGTPASEDVYVLGKDFPRIAEIKLQTRGDGQYLLASVANGDGGEFAHYLMGPDGKWTQLTRFEDKIIDAQLGLDGAVYLLSRRDAPRGKILRLPLKTPSLDQAKEIVAQIDDVIGASGSIVPTEHLLYVTYLAGGPNKTKLFTLTGTPLNELPLPEVPSVQEIAPVAKDEVLVRLQTYLQPSAVYAYEQPATFKKTALAVRSPVDFSDAEVTREFAVSADGTKVPLNVIRKKGTALDGSHPTLLYGYGGYGISMTPAFLGVKGRLWLDQGGVYVVANLRGGGEYGEEWHKAGNLVNKQHVFDDFLAAAQHLIAQKYTSPAKLVIEGGSNGGLLMGAALTQRPDLFRAVVSHVGIYDMLRVELSPNGAFNVTEFGSVTNPDQFAALYAYSPYHHVYEGVAYPSVLFMTGDHDGRVDPMNSRKMTARLQAATSSARPILLRTSSNSGHGMGTALSENIEQLTDALAFFLNELGLKLK
jgi:prolyl oligopeptidase